MSVAKAAPVTHEQREMLIHAARQGLSMTGCAHMIGRSRQWLHAARTNEPDLDAAMMRALAQYEEEVCVVVRSALRDGEPALAMAASKTLSRRFPQRHGEDARLRYATEIAGDEAAEDVPKSQSQVSGTLDDAVKSLLDWKYQQDAGE